MKVDVFNQVPNTVEHGQAELVPQTPRQMSLMAPTAIGELEKAQIDIQISTAKHFPRTISTAIEKAKNLACADPLIAKDCTYALKRGKKPITGPSIRLAEILATSWGNLRYAGRLISIEDRRVVAQGVCHDLESNSAASVEVSRSIVTKEGVRYGDDMIRVTSQAAIAIGIRNAIFKIIPGGYVAQVQRAAQRVARGEEKGLKPRLADALAFFGSLGVPEVRVLAAIDVAKSDDVEWVHIDRLVQFAASINTGEATVTEIFGSKPAPGEKAAVEDQKGEDVSEVESEHEQADKTPPGPPSGQQSFGKRAEREAAEAKASEEAKKAAEEEKGEAAKGDAGVDLQF